MNTNDDAVKMEIDGVLDLHAFQPQQVKSLVLDYMEECKKRGIHDIRIVHGKGKGVLKEVVWSVLKECEMVDDFWQDPHYPGSWGATMVRLKKSS